MAEVGIFSKIFGGVKGDPPVVRISPPAPSGDPDLDDLHLSMAYSAALPEGTLSLSGSDIAPVVERWRQLAQDGRDTVIWAERLKYGRGSNLADASQPDAFWFNALPALAALRLGYKPHPTVAMCAGVAEGAINRDDLAQEAAMTEINSRFFG